MSLALALKPQVLENWPVLGSRTALFLNRWNFVGKRQKPCGKSAKTFFWFPQVEIAGKKFFEDLFCLKNLFEKNFWRPFFFLENTCVCVLGPWPWPREGLSLALASKFFCVLGLEPCVLDSTSGDVIGELGSVITTNAQEAKNETRKHGLRISLNAQESEAKFFRKCFTGPERSADPTLGTTGLDYVHARHGCTNLYWRPHVAHITC